MGSEHYHSIPNYQNELSETAAFSLHNKDLWINNLSFTSVFLAKQVKRFTTLLQASRLT